MTAHGMPSHARLTALCANRALLTVTAVALSLGTLAAACAPAPGRPGATPRPPAPLTEVQAAADSAGASGPAVPVWVWTRAFIDGDPGAEPLTHALTWVAPTGPASSPTGTVTVWQDPAGDGSVERAAHDDDAELAAALATVGGDQTLVTDRSDWLVVTGDQVRPLLDDPRGDLTGTVSVTEYRRVLAARAAADVPGDDTGGGAGRDGDDGAGG